ncbi:MAG: ATP cone domain-containing protein [Moraxellaceae bacterium]|nr:ATP cone domain-containing protein [Moraxellaceae bacterium]
MRGVPHPLWLKKNDGQRFGFEPVRIQREIEAAGEVTGEFGARIAEVLANAVLVQLPQTDCVRADQVRECIEVVLMESGYFRSARTCIVYHEVYASHEHDKGINPAVMSMHRYLTAHLAV